MTTNCGWSFVPAVLVGALVGALLGLLLALLIVRMSLLVAGLCTLAFGQVLVVVSYNIEYVGGGSSFYGIPPFTTLVVALIGLAVALYLAWGFDRSRLGNSALAVRDDALAASAMGVNVSYVKVTVFALGAAITGAGGVLRVHYVLVVRPDDLGFFISLPLVIMWVVGGSYIFFGPAVGAILLTFIPELLRFSTTGRLIMYGLLLAVFVITRPQGLVPRTSIWRSDGVQAQFRRVLGGGRGHRAAASDPAQPAVSAGGRCPGKWLGNRRCRGESARAAGGRRTLDHGSDSQSGLPVRLPSPQGPLLELVVLR